MSSPDEIRAQIDETREELSGDLSALQDKLDPSQKAADVLERLAVSTRERPWPMAVAAFSTGWASGWVVSKL
jgi:hypothetical protein